MTEPTSEYELNRSDASRSNSLRKRHNMGGILRLVLLAIMATVILAILIDLGVQRRTHRKFMAEIQRLRSEEKESAPKQETYKTFYEGEDPLDPHGDGTLRPGDPIFDATMRGEVVYGTRGPGGWTMEHLPEPDEGDVHRVTD